MRLIAAMLVLGLAGSRTVHAEESAPHFSLSWARLSGASACISAKALAERVEARLGRSVFGAPGRADVAVEGYVGPADNGWRAVVSISDAAGAVLGTRELVNLDTTCRDLDAPLALTIALLLDPSAELSSSPAAAPAENREPAVVVSPVQSAPPPIPLPPAPLHAEPDAALRSWAALGGGLAFGLLPRPAPGMVLRVGVAARGAWPIVLDGALYREEEEVAAPRAEPIGFSLAYGGAALCPLGMERRRAAWRACAGLDAGLLSTRGLADGGILVHRRFVASATGRLEGTLYFGRHFLVAAAVSVMVPLVRDSFDYDRDGERTLVFRAPAAGATFDLGLGFRSP